MKYSIMITPVGGAAIISPTTDAVDNRDAFIKAISECISKDIQPTQISVLVLPTPPAQVDTRFDLTEQLERLEATLAHAIEAAARCERADDARFEQGRIRSLQRSIDSVKAKLDALEADHD